MVDKPIFISQPIQPIKQAAPSAKQPLVQDNTFRNVLQDKIQQTDMLKFSRHAQARLEKRDIKFSNQHLLRLEAAVKKAQAKGAKESLILIDDFALVVSIKNNTVITAVDGESRKGNVFTNIDSAVIN